MSRLRQLALHRGRPRNLQHLPDGETANRAGAMVQRPAVVLADEPTGALDLETTECVFRIFQNINSMGTAVVFIIHDLNVAARTERLVRIQDGQSCEDRGLVDTARPQ